MRSEGRTRGDATGAETRRRGAGEGGPSDTGLRVLLARERGCGTRRLPLAYIISVSILERRRRRRKLYRSLSAPPATETCQPSIYRSSFIYCPSKPPPDDPPGPPARSTKALANRCQRVERAAPAPERSPGNTSRTIDSGFAPRSARNPPNDGISRYPVALRRSGALEIRCSSPARCRPRRTRRTDDPSDAESTRKVVCPGRRRERPGDRPSTEALAIRCGGGASRGEHSHSRAHTRRALAGPRVNTRKHAKALAVPQAYQ